ncbi:MAG: carbamoyltransferase [Verrucomicrobiota bacterium]
MNILGISAFYHDSAAALIGDGKIVAAAQEERFTRKKHDPAFPVNAVAYCLEEGGIDVGDLDYVVFYEKPLLKFERLMETYLAYAPSGFASFRRAIPVWVKEKLFLPRQMREGMEDLPGEFRAKFVYTQHHESHAASAFFPSPFEKAAIITMDGVGEWTTTSIGRGEGNKVELLEEQRFPHSLGLLYSAFTYFCGFRVNSGEYKLMGLAPYGEPRYCDVIEDNLIDIKEDGSYRLNMAYFNYCQGLTMTNTRFADLFGKPVRKAETDLEEFHMDVAASIQKTTEKVMLRTAAHARELTGCENLCLAGGVALNCVANGRVLREGPFENVWIQPAAGDAGGALGAAQFVWYQLMEKERKVVQPDAQTASYLGPCFDEDAIEAFLKESGAVYERYESDEEMCRKVAGHLADEKVIGWFQGRMEFGPRALGGRSILGDARSTSMQKVMNLKIKFRESFRPFAPSVRRERVDEFFDMRPNEDSPYMLLVADVKEEKRSGDGAALREARGLDKLPVPRSEVQAVTHVDYSARVQTIDEGRHPLYYRLIQEFEGLTGSPVLINTSFNVRGEPIVCTPEDAFRCFMATNMDVLALGKVVLEKSKQPNAVEIDAEAHLSKFALD